MAAVLAAASYSRIGFSLCLSVRTRRVRVPGGNAFHLEPGTIIVLSNHSQLGLKSNQSLMMFDPWFINFLG